MSTSGKGKGPFGSEWPTPENTTGKDLDPRAAGDSANEAALKDFFFGSSATVHNGGAVTLSVSVSLSTLADPAVLYSPGPVTLAAAVTLTPGTPTVVPPASTPLEYPRSFNSYRQPGRRTYGGRIT